MDYNMIMRTGKYAGYTIGEMAFKDPSYYRWVKENRPEMLKSHKPKSKGMYGKPQAQKLKPIDPEVLEERRALTRVEPGSPSDAF
jgi:hypothetical protein